MAEAIRILHIPALFVWLVGLFGIIYQVYGISNFLSVWANAIISPSTSNVGAFLGHAIMMVVGIAAHAGIEKIAG